MLDLDGLDLDELSMALEDRTPEHSWWLDPETGALELSATDLAEDDGSPEARGLVFVEPIGSDEGYADMEEFATSIGDERARELLLHSLAGRGAFRRFKDTLLQFPELRESWFAFHDARMKRRAIEWLGTAGLLSPDVVDEALGVLPSPDVHPVSTPTGARELAEAVAADLAELYGDRLKMVVLFGSRARGDAHPESDIDLLVVLDEVRSRRKELARMSDLLWSHSLAHDTVITELPISAAEYDAEREPLVLRARAEGVRVA